MKRALLAAFLIVALVATLGACGDDDDTVATSPDGAATTTAEEEAVATTSTTAAAAEEPTYEFAVTTETNLAPWFMPTLVDSETFYGYPGQVVPLLFIELDPGGDPCPTDGELALTDADGTVVATASQSAEIEIPEDDVEGPLTLTVRCERDGETGVGILEPIRVAQLVDVTVTPTTITTGGSVSVEVPGGCPEGLDGKLGLTPAEGGGFGVLGETPPLGDDGTGELTVPEGATGTFYATVQCFDGETMAVGFTAFEATES